MLFVALIVVRHTAIIIRIVVAKQFALIATRPDTPSRSVTTTSGTCQSSPSLASGVTRPDMFSQGAQCAA